MKHLLVVLLMLVLPGCANLKTSAQAAVGADIATTTLGVASGLTELNPLITSPAALVATGVARAVAIHFVDQRAEPERTETLAAMSAVTWGIAASNAVIIASSSNPAGIVAGIIIGYLNWKSTEPERRTAQICAVSKDCSMVAK